MSDQPPAKVDLWTAILTVFWGAVLTYFFFEPGKNAVADFIGRLLPTGW